MKSVLALALVLFGVTAAYAGQESGLPRSDTGEPAASSDRPPLQPPASPEQPASSMFHGIRVDDPYRWLEDINSPEVMKWVTSQNTYAEHMLAKMPDGKPMARRVRELAITSTSRTTPLLVHGTLFYLQETPPQPQAVLVARPWPAGKAEVLVDPNQAGGHVAITGYWPSPEGRYVAYGTAHDGKELTTIHVLDVSTGKSLPDTLHWAGGGTSSPALAWDADGKGFVYMRFPPPREGAGFHQFHAALVHHVLGKPARTDQVVFGKNYSAVAEYRLQRSRDGRRLAVLVRPGDGAPWEVYFRRHGRWGKVLGKEANVRGAVWDGDRLLVRSFQDAKRGKVLAVDAASGKVTLVLGQRKGALQRLAPVGDGFLVVRSWGPQWWVEQYLSNGRFVRRLALPAHDMSIGGIASEAGQEKALITYGGWIQPTRWARYDAHDGSLKTVFKVKPAADYSRVKATRIEGTSEDGTRVPVTVLHMKGVVPNGRRPTILYSYGGFDSPIQPVFIGSKLAWLERGGVFAYANIRGGNEYGEAWHGGGMKTHKQHVFDDFYAAAKALKSTGWTDTSHLGILGASNGGLLMGAELTQHPEAFGAVVSNVGIYDMLRHMTQWTNGKYNVPEYGSPTRSKAVFRAMLAYSPLHNTKSGTAYPPVLMTEGLNDQRVAPWQMRKFCAALQNATTSGHPIMCLTHMDAGHGMDASFAQRVGDTTIELTFFARELGLGKPQ